jgi:dTDP-4-dehydrorhamnose reductase
MKILITGARGQLGQDCAKVLGTENTVYGFSSQDLDISNHDQIKQHFQVIKPDFVVNCAAYTAVDKCETDQDDCWRVNAEGAGIIASICAENKAQMIHISTDYVFDGNKSVPKPYKEKDPVHPLSQYGASKQAGEEQIRNILEDHLIFRTAWLYGIGGSNFFKTMLRLAVSDPNRTIRVVNDQYGSLTWTHRLALQIKTLLTKDVTGTFHATAEGHSTWYDGAKLFLETMKVPFTLEPCSTNDYPTPARRPTNSILANNHLKKNKMNRMVPWDEDVVAFANKFRDKLLAEVSG